MVLGLGALVLAIWIEAADDGETYFWSALFWPILLLALVWSAFRSIWERDRILDVHRRALVRHAFRRTRLFRHMRFRPRRMK